MPPASDQYHESSSRFSCKPHPTKSDETLARLSPGASDKAIFQTPSTPHYSATQAWKHLPASADPAPASYLAVANSAASCTSESLESSNRENQPLPARTHHKLPCSTPSTRTTGYPDSSTPPLPCTESVLAFSGLIQKALMPSIWLSNLFESDATSIFSSNPVHFTIS